MLQTPRYDERMNFDTVITIVSVLVLIAGAAVTVLLVSERRRDHQRACKLQRRTHQKWLENAAHKDALHNSSKDAGALIPASPTTCSAPFTS